MVFLYDLQLGPVVRLVISYFSSEPYEVVEPYDKFLSDGPVFVLRELGRPDDGFVVLHGFEHHPIALIIIQDELFAKHK